MLSKTGYISVLANEIERSLAETLDPEGSKQEETDPSALGDVSAEQKLDSALNLIVQAAEIFENLGLEEQSEKINGLIEELGTDSLELPLSIAEKHDILLEKLAKSKKKTPKSKKTTKKPAKKTKTTKKDQFPSKEKLEEVSEDLTPEQAISNLKEFGWLFPLEENKESECMPCMMSDDSMSNPMKKNEDYGGNWLDKMEAEDNFPSLKEEELPGDYESCGECDFDHSYEPQESFESHKKMKEGDDEDFDWLSDK